MRQTVTVRVQMNEKIFRHFAMFDTFRLKKRWRSPILFAAIMLAFAVVCFLLKDKAQSAFIGSLLMIIGLSLPAVYITSYLAQINAQIKQFQLKKKPRKAYTLTLGDDIRIVNDMKPEPEVTLPWDKVFGVWRGKDAAYLYVTPAKAFLLPDGQADVNPGQLWDFLETKLPAEKLHGIRK